MRDEITRHECFNECAHSTTKSDVMVLFCTIELITLLLRSMNEFGFEATTYPLVLLHMLVRGNSNNVEPDQIVLDNVTQPIADVGPDETDETLAEHRHDGGGDVHGDAIVLASSCHGGPSEELDGGQKCLNQPDDEVEHLGHVTQRTEEAPHLSALALRRRR